MEGIVKDYFDSEINPDTHIYLYAKKVYEWTDPIQDLKKIIGSLYLLEPTCITDEEVADVLLNLTINKLVELERVEEVSKMIMECNPSNIKNRNEKYTESVFLNRIVLQCLLKLRFMCLEDIGELGPPDVEILLVKQETK